MTTNDFCCAASPLVATDHCAQSVVPSAAGSDLVGSKFEQSAEEEGGYAEIGILASPAMRRTQERTLPLRTGCARRCPSKSKNTTTGACIGTHTHRGPSAGRGQSITHQHPQMSSLIMRAVRRGRSHHARPAPPNGSPSVTGADSRAPSPRPASGPRRSPATPTSPAPPSQP